MSTSLKNAFLRFTHQHKLFNRNRKILIALSGGVDSMVLLHLLLEWQKRLDIELVALHINHHLRGEESERDQKFVQNFCEKKKIPIYIERLNVKKFAAKNKYSLEEAGHILRERIYRQYLESKNFDVVATAHNLNDQAETILMHIMEGTGLEGLGGIKLQKGRIVRPLLFASRQEIEDYAAKKDIPYKIDQSNKDLRFKRNKIRHQLLPFLAQEFSLHKLDNFLRMSLVLQDWLAYSNKLIKEFEKKIEIDKKKQEISFKISAYRKLFSGIQIKLLENISQQLTGSKIKLDHNSFQGFKLWLEAEKQGTKYHLPPQVLMSRRGEYLILRDISNSSFKIKLEIPSENVYNLSESGIQFVLKEVKPDEVKFTHDHSVEFIDKDKVVFPLVLRNWNSGDKFQPLGANFNRSVSDFLTDLKIKFPRKRSALVLEQGGQIIALPGYRIGEKFKLTAKTKRVLSIELRHA